MSLSFEARLDDVGVDNVTVMGISESACLARDAEWLDILPSAYGGGWIADVADASMPGESGEGFFREDIPYQAGALVDADPLVRTEDG
jgi:hypothetical protein